MPNDAQRILTPKIRALVATDRLSRPPVGRLTSRHVESLTAIARGAADFDEDVSARRALSALAEGARPEHAVPVLAEVLSDVDAPTPDRIAAARGLAHVATQEATEALLPRLRERDPRVQQAVIAGLGQVGGPTELAQVAKLPVPADTATRRQLTFTKALIAHRHGLDGPFLPEEPTSSADVPDEQRVRVTLRLQSPQKTAADRERLVGSRWGITLAERSYAVGCGRSSFTLFANKEVGESVTSAERTFERPLIAGVLARWYPRNVRATPQLLILTRPQDEGARLELVRTDGRVDYVGQLAPRGTAVGFRVTNAERAATSETLVEGNVTGRGIRLEVAFSSSRRDTPETTAALP